MPLIWLFLLGGNNMILVKNNQYFGGQFIQKKSQSNFSTCWDASWHYQAKWPPLVESCFECVPLNFLPTKKLRITLFPPKYSRDTSTRKPVPQLFFIGCCTFSMEFLKSWPLSTGRRCKMHFQWRSELFRQRLYKLSSFSWPTMLPHLLWFQSAYTKQPAEACEDIDSPQHCGYNH